MFVLFDDNGPPCSNPIRQSTGSLKRNVIVVDGMDISACTDSGMLNVAKRHVMLP
jgi:hypothetical protein